MPQRKKKIIIDTNLWISYLISKRYKFLDNLIFTKKIELLFSQELIVEFIEVAKRDKLKSYFHTEDVLTLLKLFRTYGRLIEVNETIVNSCRDPKDNFLLSLAFSGHADYLITGDKDLLEIQSIGKTRILTIKEFEQFFTSFIKRNSAK